MCQAMQELRADWFTEGHNTAIALTGRLYKFLQNNANADNATIAAACDCTVDDVIEIRTALGI